MKKLTESEKAYWAGILDGEGCLRKCQNNGFKIPRITLKMTCKATLDAFGGAFGVNVRSVNRHKGYKDHWKDAWVADINGVKAGNVCEELLPYLITKREIALELIEYYYKNCNICGERYKIKAKSSKYCGSLDCQQKVKDQNNLSRRLKRKGAN